MANTGIEGDEALLLNPENKRDIEEMGSSQNNRNSPTANIIEKTLYMLSKHWEKRAVVKNDKSNDAYQACFDNGKEDYNETLLPFYHHPHWQSASKEFKSHVLSWAWIIYNQKTIHIEVEIINPVLEAIILEKIPGATDYLSKKIASETYVDETYHTLMAVNACNIVSVERNLGKIVLPEYDLIFSQKKVINEQNDQQKNMLLRLATASVSETLISSYLDVLSKDMSINSFCRMTIDAHRKDELAHANLFTGIMKKIFPNLSKEQQEYYLSMLPCAIRWFASKELRLWGFVLNEINFPNHREMLSEISELETKQIDTIDYSGPVKLAEGLGCDIASYFHKNDLEIIH
ncbi:diiron oxygenase [Fastidiosibacter lacustris]|uniref:diiron oxygenase n=1 Tax=Fastidiosibacter lacustris TaxID=2056695 RepID=UPI00130045C5|nr:diiron oxygenase [Fastidiosibacter lacustris]